MTCLAHFLSYIPSSIPFAPFHFANHTQDIDIIAFLSLPSTHTPLSFQPSLFFSRHTHALPFLKVHRLSYNPLVPMFIIHFLRSLFAFPNLDPVVFLVLTYLESRSFSLSFSLSLSRCIASFSTSCCEIDSEEISKRIQVGLRLFTFQPRESFQSRGRKHRALQRVQW